MNKETQNPNSFGAYQWAKKLHKQRTGDKRNPWPYINDTDKDGTPDIVDCKPKDPKKQGLGYVGHAIGQAAQGARGVVGKVAQSYHQYKEEAPQREEKRIEALKRRTRFEEERAKQEEIKAKVEAARARVRKSREVGRPKYNTGGGYSPGMGLMGSGMFEERPPSKPKALKTKPRKRRTKRKQKSKQPQFIVRGGKAYPIA